MERPAKEGESPVIEMSSGLRSIPSRTAHVKRRLNPGGPPSKAKYCLVTDSAQYREGKVKKNPC